MKIYSNETEEKIYFLKKLKIWLNSRLITEEQYIASKKELPRQYKASSLFFRVLFAGFTLVSIMSFMFFIMWAFDIRISREWGWLYLFSGIFYGIAEFSIKKLKFYRHGAEESLISGSVLCFIFGTIFMLDKFRFDSNITLALFFTIAFFSLILVYFRFGYIGAFILSLPCIGSVPFILEYSQTGARLIVITIFSLFLFINIRAADNNYNFLRLNNSIIRAVLYLGIYLMTNLRLDAIRIPKGGVSNHVLKAYAGFTPFVYWSSYVLVFVIPALGIYYGIKLKQRAIIVISSIMLMISIITNKDYLGITHYEWDPIIFGILLVSSALLIIRYLSKGENKTRNGFTYRNFLKPEDHGINIAVIASAFTIPEVSSTDTHGFGGGESGGAGAGRQF